MKFNDVLEMARVNRRLMRSQWWNKEKLNTYQNRRLVELVRHAYEHSEFYKALYDRHEISTDDFHGLDCLPTLPIVEREDMQTSTARVTTVDVTVPGCTVTASTSGSSGKPFTVHFSRKEFVRIHRAPMTRVYREYGRRIYHKVAYFAHPGSMNRTPKSILSRLIPHRFYLIDNTLLIDEQVERLIELDPQVITGYTNSVEVIARAILERNIESVRPKLVYTGAQSLSPYVRTLVRNAFAVELYDTYSSVEFGSIAWECPSRSGAYHINDDILCLEVVDAKGMPVAKGESGEVVITALLNWTHPLIRYRLGDIAMLAKSDCECGRGLTSLSRIEGRVMDALRLPDGRQINSNYFANMFKRNLKIRQYQVIQKSHTDLVLRIVKSDDSCDISEERQRVEDDLQYYSVEVEYVDDIRVSKSGKFRTMILLDGAPTS